MALLKTKYKSFFSGETLIAPEKLLKNEKHVWFFFLEEFENNNKKIGDIIGKYDWKLWSIYESLQSCVLESFSENVSNL
mgnify:CR=1 FL=1